MEGAKTIVLSQNSFSRSGILSADSPKAAIRQAEKEGVGTLIVVGGSETWQAFLNDELCDEIIFDVEPILLGYGMRFNKKLLKLELLNTKILQQGVIQNRYKVLR